MGQTNPNGARCVARSVWRISASRTVMEIYRVSARVSSCTCSVVRRYGNPVGLGSGPGSAHLIQLCRSSQGHAPATPTLPDPAPKVPHRPGAAAAHIPYPRAPTYIVLRLRSQLESPEAPPVSRGSQSRAGDPTLQSSQNLRTTRGSTRSLGQAKCRLGGSAVLTCASYPLCWTSRLRGFHAPCTLLRARTNR